MGCFAARTDDTGAERPVEDPATVLVKEIAPKHQP